MLYRSIFHIALRSSKMLRFLLVLTSFVLVNSQFKDVSTEQGVVRGYLEEDDVYTFYGIPYASAPTGEDRFKAPLPAPTRNEIFNATHKYVACAQTNTMQPDLDFTMDCLILHIFAPDTQEIDLPVLVNIHGGAYQTGYPAGAQGFGLARKGMIVVSITYRLGVYGFLCLNTEYAPGNAGMKDQVAALRWVKSNIANFGGDPENISLGGSSAGSFAVDLHILSPTTDGLFVRAISESGSGIGPESWSPYALTIADNYASQFNVSTGEDVQTLEAFFRSLTDEQLRTRYSSNYKFVGFCPCIETHNIAGVEKFLQEDPLETLISGNYEKVPYLTGFTTMEGMQFIPSYDANKPLMEANFTDFLVTSHPFKSESDVGDVTQKIWDIYFSGNEIGLLGYIYFFTDIVFSHKQYASARLHAKNEANVYLYVFSYNGSLNFDIPSPIVGPGHIAQTMYVYDMATTDYSNMSPEDFIMRDRLRDIYYNYCKYGEPRTTLINAEWLPVAADSVNYMIIDNEFSLSQNPIQDRFSILDEIYEFPYTASAVAWKVSSILILCHALLALIW